MVGDNNDYSVMTNVELKKLFKNKKIRKVQETSLSGKQEKAEMEKRRLIWKVEGSAGEEVKREAVDEEELMVELAPMEIRTFLIKFDDHIEMVGEERART